MRTKKTLKTQHFIIPLTLLIGFFALIASSPVHAQNDTNESALSKPQLALITVNEETSDAKAKELVRSLVNRNAKTDKVLEMGDFDARYVPLTREGKEDSFIVARFTSSEFGGCYASGCYTIIYQSTDNDNTWRVVFAAFVPVLYYDKGSRDDRHANLVITTQGPEKRMALWMWDGKEYVLVNAR